MTPYLYPAPPPSSPTMDFLSSSFSTLPMTSPVETGRGYRFNEDYLDTPVNYPTMRRNSLGLEMEGETGSSDERMEEDSSFPSTFSSPPLVPFSFPPRTTTSSSSLPACPRSPPLVALSLPNNFSSNPSSPSTSSEASCSTTSPPRPQRSVAHPLHTTSKLRLEMTPLPTFHLPLPDMEMSPPWTTSDLAGPPPPSFKPRKNSVVSLPVAPPTPPLTPNEELPAFNWGKEPEQRGRSTEVTPIAKRRRFH